MYHLFPTLLPGGFLGVDIFFVISGFLITSLLLREFEVHGRLRLLNFWRRRARRLLPALALVLLVCTTLALLFGGDLLVGIAGQLGGAALFLSNWVFIANGADYFARDTPELFRNTWSLSIEEQFYVLFPILCIALWRLRGRVARAVPLLVLAALSASLMVTMSLNGADPTRIYFGSDTHTFGLFLGAALATLLGSRGPVARGTQTALSARQQIVATAVAATGLAVLAWLAFTLVEGGAASFQGGFQLASLASLAVVVAVTRQGTWIGRALDTAPLRWIGERSYGIYLWHWPALLLITASGGPWRNTPAATWVVGALTLFATFGIAALSYRFVEQPVRALGLRSSVRRFLSLLFTRNSTEKATEAREESPATANVPHKNRRPVWVFVAAATLLLTIPASLYATVTAPRVTTSAAAIARGQAALDEQQREAEHKTPEEPATKSSIPTFTGADVSAVGDSVMLASLPELTEKLPDITVDAAVSRSMSAGIDVVTELAGQQELRNVLLVGLGTNGPVSPEELQSMRQAAGSRPLILVNAHGERDWIPGVNETLSAFANAHRGVVVAEWDHAVVDVPDALAGDGIHPNPSGGYIYASAVQTALAALQTPEEAQGYSVSRR